MNTEYIVWARMPAWREKNLNCICGVFKISQYRNLSVSTTLDIGEVGFWLFVCLLRLFICLVGFLLVG